MKAITDAIAARRAQIKQLQADIDALQRAASVLGGKTTAKTTPARQPRNQSYSAQRQAKAEAVECGSQEGDVEEDQGVLGEAEESQAVGVGPGSGHSRSTLALQCATT